MSHANNKPAIMRVFHEVLFADLAYWLVGTPHAQFLRRRVNLYKGQARREIEKIIALGDKAKGFVDYMISECMEFSA